MANLPLRPGEQLIGQGMMAYWEPVLGNSCNTWSGILYVTDQRICFYHSWPSFLEFERNLSDLRGFTVGKHLFFTQVTLHSKIGETFTFTGFPVKKLQVWLRQAGVQRIEHNVYFDPTTYF